MRLVNEQVHFRAVLLFGKPDRHFFAHCLSAERSGIYGGDRPMHLVGPTRWRAAVNLAGKYFEQLGPALRAPRVRVGDLRPVVQDQRFWKGIRRNFGFIVIESLWLRSD